MIFEYFLGKFSYSVAMATNQIKWFGKIHMFGRGLLKDNFYKTFVKISVVKKQ